MKYLFGTVATAIIYICLGLFWLHAIIWTIILVVFRFIWEFKIDASFTSLERDELHQAIPYPTVFKSYVHYHIAIEKLPLLTETNNNTLSIRTIRKPDTVLVNKVLKHLIKSK